MTQLPGNRVSFSLSFLSLLAPQAQQNASGHAPPAADSHRPHIPCATTTPGLQLLSAVTPEQKTPNLPIPFLCLNLCLAQIQPLSLCLPQGKSRPLQTAAVAEQEVQRQEGAGEPDTKHGCSPACQDHHLPQEAFGDPRATIPVPPSLSLPRCQRAANPEQKLTSFHLYRCRQRLRLPALHSSALCTLLYKKRLA